MYIQTESFKIKDSPHRFAEMGSGYGLFFIYFKYLIIILAVPFMISASWNVIRNLKGNDCLNYNSLSEANLEFEKTNKALNEKNNSNKEIFKEEDNSGNYIKEQSSNSNKKKEESNKKSIYHKDNLLDFLLNREGTQISNSTKEKFLIENNIYSKKYLSTAKNLNYFMMTHCISKIITGDPDCKAYEEDKCEKDMTQKCFKIAMNKFSKEYEGKVCMVGLGTVTSIGNRIDEEDKNTFWFYIRPFLNILIVIFAFAALVYISLNLNKTARRYDLSTVSVKDYSILISGISLEIAQSLGNDIEVYIKDLFEYDGYQVTQINFIYDVSEYIKKKKNIAVF